MTVTLGVDPHKASHTVVATDPVGRPLTQTTSRGTRTSDHQELIGWAGQRWPERTWAVEDCRQVAGRRLGDLLAAGEQVVLVPPRLMAQTRQASRVPGKSDPIDALAVARAALAEPNLPQARLDGPARELKLLVGHREDLVAERTRVENRLRWHLHDLDPERAAMLPTRHLEQRRVLDELEAWVAELPDSVQVAIVRELVARCRVLTLRANQLQASCASGSCGSALPAEPAGVWGPDRGQDRRRGRRGGPVPLRGGLGHARRGSAAGVLLRGLAAPPPVPGG